MKLLTISIALLLTFACTQGTPKKDNMTSKTPNTTEQNLEVAYFASGCFWCVEAIFEHLKGVSEVISGYSGGSTKNPSYREVVSGSTGHAEAVAVYYDPKIVSFEILVKVFFGSQDPTTLNQQGPDRGTQYRSIAFYSIEQEKSTIEKVMKHLNETVYDGKIVTEVIPFEQFYPAEDYHQDYEKKQSQQPLHSKCFKT